MIGSSVTFERLWHTIILPSARGFEWFVWRSVMLAFLIKLMFFSSARG
jgi:hypothetical protein